MKKAFLLFILLVLPSATFAAEPLMEPPRWSLEVKGGMFSPALKNWSRNFGSGGMGEFAGSFAYKFLPQVELGAGAGMMKREGKVFNLYHGDQVGDVTYELNPVNLFLMLRGVLTDGQWVVPYIGGGWTRIFYREKFSDGETVRGSADGYHLRGGLQLSLDNLDPNASSMMFNTYRVLQTYFFVEAEYSRVVARSASINLGGTAYRAGLLFEF